MYKEKLKPKYQGEITHLGFDSDIVIHLSNH